METGDDEGVPAEVVLVVIRQLPVHIGLINWDLFGWWKTAQKEFDGKSPQELWEINNSGERQRIMDLVRKTVDAFIH